MFYLLEVTEALDPYPPGSKALSMVRDLTSLLLEDKETAFWRSGKGQRDLAGQEASKIGRLAYK
jgi:hypothetical protein